MCLPRCAGLCDVNLTQAKVVGEEGALIKKMPPKDWVVGKAVGHFLN